MHLEKLGKKSLDQMPADLLGTCQGSSPSLFACLFGSTETLWGNLLWTADNAPWGAEMLSSAEPAASAGAKSCFWGVRNHGFGRGLFKKDGVAVESVLGLDPIISELSSLANGIYSLNQYPCIWRPGQSKAMRI